MTTARTFIRGSGARYTLLAISVGRVIMVEALQLPREAKRLKAGADNDYRQVMIIAMPAIGSAEVEALNAELQSPCSD